MGRDKAASQIEEYARAQTSSGVSGPWALSLNPEGGGCCKRVERYQGHAHASMLNMIGGGSWLLTSDRI